MSYLNAFFQHLTPHRDGPYAGWEIPKRFRVPALSTIKEQIWNKTRRPSTYNPKKVV